jgi:Transglutaminase-like superfamily
MIRHRARGSSAVPGSERLLLVRCVATVGAIRLALWVLPFRVVRRAVQRWPGRVRDPATTEPAKVASSVERAGQMIPAATCLTRALAAQVLMRRRGIETELRLGVRRGPGGWMEAHAWIEHEGRILVGAHGVPTFSPLEAGARDAD